MFYDTGATTKVIEKFTFFFSGGLNLISPSSVRAPDCECLAFVAHCTSFVITGLLGLSQDVVASRLSDAVVFVSSFKGSFESSVLESFDIFWAGLIGTSILFELFDFLLLEFSL